MGIEKPYNLDIESDEFNRWLNATLISHKKWLKNEKGGKRADLSNLNLVGIDLSYADLRKADLSYSNMSQSNLIGASLYKANLNNTNLSYSDLSECNLSYASFKCADLSYTDFNYSNLSYADFTCCNLSCSDLSCCDLNGTYFIHSNLINSILIGVNFDNVDFYDVLVFNTVIKDNKGNRVKLKKAFTVTSIGSRNDRAIIFITKDDKILIQCGCFLNYVNEFKEEVRRTHKDNKFAEQYLALIKLAEIMI